MRNIWMIIVFISACRSQQTRERGKRHLNGNAVQTVVYIMDGDTFTLNDGTIIRLTGIDAPETKDNFHGKRGEYANEAKLFMKTLVFGKAVRLEYDVGRTDRYRRTLAYVFVNDSIFVNAEMVRLGYAKAYTVPPNVKHAALFLQLEQEARALKRGLWSFEE